MCDYLTQIKVEIQEKDVKLKKHVFSIQDNFKMKQQNEPSAPTPVVYVVQDSTVGKVDKKAIEDAHNVKATPVLGIAHICYHHVFL